VPASEALLVNQTLTTRRRTPLASSSSITSLNSRISKAKASYPLYDVELFLTILPALHDPSKHLSTAQLKKLGYPPPIVNHMEVKERVVRRYANPGKE